jgi:hypothetical protein
MSAIPSAAHANGEPLIASIRLAASRCGIPEYMHGGLVRYLVNHIAPGDFLGAVLANDLRRACSHADDQNKHLLRNYVQFFYSHAPSTCWGSREKVQAWLEELREAA